ncbi:MAG: galactose-phosphate uridylyltransferase [Patescibacteria group bacterium]|nr:galactose-phosphate uridylyltransferase [Patescibacteria group bacterium]
MNRPNPSSNPSSSNAEIRKHYFLDQYVIIAPKRNLRPDSFSHASEPHKAPSDHCPFCHNAEPSLWQLPRGKNWRVKVIPNAFAALTTDNPQAFGIQEVVLNTPDHTLEFSELPVEHILEIFTAYRQRLAELKQQPGIRYVLIFKNDGPMAGASVAHAHCQIFGLPLIPPKLEQEGDALNHYWDQHQACAYCHILDWEIQQRTRVITGDKHFIALSPHAASHGFETWLLPRRHVNQFSEFNLSELHSLATILRKITARLDAAGISFNYFLQESLPNQNHHFVLKIEPRITKWAGAELSTGLIINPVTPEYATLWYQGKINR